MKTLIITLIAIFTLHTTYAQEEPFTDYHANGKIKSKGFKDKEGHKIGAIKYYHENGKLSSEGKLSYVPELKNPWDFDVNRGKIERNGQWKQYNKEGHLTSLRVYNIETRIYYYENYYKNGQTRQSGYLSSKRTYKGTPDGQKKEYYENGQLKKISKYKNRQIVGSKSYYENGQLKLIDKYTNGLIFEWKSYYETGQLKGIGEGGRRKYYRKDGILVRVKEDNSKNQLIKDVFIYERAKYQTDIKKIDIEVIKRNILGNKIISGKSYWSFDKLSEFLNSKIYSKKRLKDDYWVYDVGFLLQGSVKYYIRANIYFTKETGYWIYDGYTTITYQKNTNRVTL